MFLVSENIGGMLFKAYMYVVYIKLHNNTYSLECFQNILLTSSLRTSHCDIITNTKAHLTCFLSSALLGQSHMTQLKLVTLSPGKVNFLLRLVHFICYSSTFYNVVTRIDESKTCLVDVSIEIDFNADSQSKYPWIVVQL